MTSLEWIPEPYPASGGLAAAGFYKLLGRPRLDPLTVLVRETAQNSWDARLPGQQVRFVLDGRTPVAGPVLDSLRSIVFTDAARLGTGLDTRLSGARVDTLLISDRGTRGLGGPVAADEVSADGVYDWVDFVLNVGKPNLHGHTGGTYGFGKTITYIVSAVNAAVIHSHSTVNGERETRLIACAIGDEFDMDGRLHTGRHWWGRRRGDTPAPVTGDEADTIAESLGMPGFTSDETGTDILLIDPDLGGRTATQAARFLADSVTWHLWPKLMPHHSRKQPMTVRVSWNGDPVEVPEPAERPPLHGFAQAYRALLDDVDVGRRADGLERTVVRSLRPIKDVGDLVTVPLVARRRADVDDGHRLDDEESPASAAAFSGACHHVALLRTPELVIDYLPGPPPLEGGTEWAAVFRCRDDVDVHFAHAEPPTHDSWRPELLPKSPGRTIVKVGLQRVQRFLADRWGPAPDAAPAAATASTATVADDLSFLVRSTPGLGAGRQPRATAGGGVRRTQIDLLDSGVAVVEGGALASTATVRVVPRTAASAVRLRVTAAVALDETGADPDLDPELVLVSADIDGVCLPLDGTAAAVTLPVDASTVVTVTARRGPHTAVRFDFTTDEVPT